MMSSSSECKECCGSACYICRTALDEANIAYHRALENSPKHLAKCGECVKAKNKFGIFHTVIDQFHRVNRCEVCKESILGRANLINGCIFICEKCVDTTISIEALNQAVNTLLA